MRGLLELEYSTAANGTGFAWTSVSSLDATSPDLDPTDLHFRCSRQVDRHSIFHLQNSTEQHPLPPWRLDITVPLATSGAATRPPPRQISIASQPKIMRLQQFDEVQSDIDVLRWCCERRGNVRSGQSADGPRFIAGPCPK